jgi:hypothetical protein
MEPGTVEARPTAMRTVVKVLLPAVAALVLAGCGQSGAADTSAGGSANSSGNSTSTGNPLHHLDPHKYDVSSAVLVRPGGAGGSVLVLARGKPVPRGGYQLHLLAPTGNGSLAEVTNDGRPLLPFVATDGGGLPMTAACTKDGKVVVYTAQAHQPPGVALAWDVTGTTYTLHGDTAQQSATKLVRKAVADPTLRKQMPDLFHPAKVFAGCTVRPG